MNWLRTGSSDGLVQSYVKHRISDRYARYNLPSCEVYSIPLESGPQMVLMAVVMNSVFWDITNAL
jgi:hypothetical protein